MAVARRSCNKTASSSDISTKSAEEPLDLEDHEGVLFYVNRDGFPTSKRTYERMWAYAQKIHPEGAREMQSIRQSKSLDKVIAKSSGLIDCCNEPIIFNLFQDESIAILYLQNLRQIRFVPLEF